MTTYNGAEWQAPITNPNNDDVECLDCGDVTDAVDSFCQDCTGTRILAGNNGVGPFCKLCGTDGSGDCAAGHKHDDLSGFRQLTTS